MVSASMLEKARSRPANPLFARSQQPKEAVSDGTETRRQSHQSHGFAQSQGPVPGCSCSAELGFGW